MGLETDQGPTNQAPDAKTKYLVKLLPVIKQRGLSHARIEDLVQAMSISKATFYKHFSSKEEVIEGVVELVVGYFSQASAVIADEASPYIERFQRAFQHSVVIASYLSEAFLVDLKQAHPALWERVKQAQQAQQRHLQQFYQGGMTAGIFQPLNARVVALQDEVALRALVDPLFLMEHDLTVGTSLHDWYEAHKYQWLTPAARGQIDDAPIKAYIDLLARKIALSLRADRGLDIFPRPFLAKPG